MKNILKPFFFFPEVGFPESIVEPGLSQNPAKLLADCALGKVDLNAIKHPEQYDESDEPLDTFGANRSDVFQRLENEINMANSELKKPKEQPKEQPNDNPE